MLFGNRRSRILNARRLTAWCFQPRGELLEAKVLLAAIDLGGTSPPSLPRSASAPYGIDMAGTTSSLGAGWSVADIGDLTGNGYDDILVGAPTLNGSPSKLGSASGGSVYLVFGSQYVNSSSAVTVQNWLNVSGATQLAANDRVGNLSSLGASSQTNPVSGSAVAFPFAGVTFTATGVDATSSFGASVAEVKTSSGYGILIGAPNAPDANNDSGSSGTGKVFLITGNFLSMNGKTVDVDTPSTYGNLTVLTIESNANGAGELGYSVAGGLNMFGDSAGDVIIGAPFATIGTTANGGTPVANTGAVYLISAALLPNSSTTFNVSTALGTGPISNAVILAGEADGDEAGWSVADAGDVNGASGTVDDLLIGAPDNLGIGAAYLVYGGSSLGSQATLTNNVYYINLARVAGTSTPTVSGAKIGGPGAGAETGFSVSAGGDFNADGLDDFLIGSPTYNLGSTTDSANSGEVDLIYGSSTALTGTITLGALTGGVTGATFTGGDLGDMAGYAVSEVGVINKGQPTSILIGAPGYSSNNGTAYLIPGRAGLTGSYSLSTAQAAPLSALQFVETTPATSGGNFFGASLSGRLQGSQQNTVDLDNEADFVIGAPGINASGSSSLTFPGGVQIVESGFLVVPIPSSNSITTTIGVGTPFAPFSINATTPANLQIYVFGVPATSTTPEFAPVTDIDPTTVKVNGIAFPTATLVGDPDTADWLNGIQDAIITISPRSSLNLPSGTVTFVVSGQTLSTSPLPNYAWTGSTSVTVTGGSGGSTTPVSGGVGGVASGPVLDTEFISPFGANTNVPSLSQLSALSYQPIPLSVALQQYGPAPGFAQRNYSYYHPGKKLGPQYTSRGQNTRPDGEARGTTTLSSHVFDRTTFHAQKVYTFTHKAPKSVLLKGVVPVQSRTERFVDNLLH